MYKSYHLKSCLILIAVVIVSSTMLRIGDFKLFHVWQFLGRSISISIYIFCCWLIHAWFKQKDLIMVNQFCVPLSLASGVISVLFLSYLHIFFIPADFQMPEFPFEPTATDFVKRITQGFILSMISYIVYNTVFSNHMLNHTRLENEHFKQAHLRAQLLTLQQQISPHFLFNSLSTLKIITKEIDTKRFVIQLSHVYRYLLGINDSPTTKLNEELTFIKSYLYILECRFGAALEVSVHIPNEYLDYLLPSLSLQLLIENAIKHNVTSPHLPLYIRIHVNNTGELVVTNANQPKKAPVEGTKLGLQNIRDRYRLLFARDIRVDHTIESFTVTLPLIPYEHHYN